MWKGDPEGLGGKGPLCHQSSVPENQTGMRWAGAWEKDDPSLIPSPGCGYPGSRGSLTGTRNLEEAEQLPGWGGPMCVLGDFMSPDHAETLEGGSQREGGLVCKMGNKRLLEEHTGGGNARK